MERETVDEKDGLAVAPRSSRSRRHRAHRRLWALVLGLFAILVFDLCRAPSKQWTAAVLLWGIDVYQAAISPRLSGTIACRFEPTCSHYAEASIRQHGALVGSARTFWRLLRCGPWTPMNTSDPP